MTPAQLAELDAARRTAGHYVEPWKARGDQVYTTDGAQVVKVAKFVNVDAAHYTARIHNLFLLLVNELIELQRRFLDRKKVSE